MGNELFLGIDVGGTKISSALVTSRGKIISREKIPTPVEATSRIILKTIKNLIQVQLDQNNLKIRSIKGVGLGVPGIVAVNQTDILAAPNIKLSGISLKKELRNFFRVPILAGNDVNLGLLGEQWLGSARNLK